MPIHQLIAAGSGVCESGRKKVLYPQQSWTMTKIQNSRHDSATLDSPCQPKGSTKSINVVDSLQLTQNDSLPFDERENLMFSDGVSAGVFFSPSDEEGESRTGPSSDVSSGNTAIVATTATELMTVIKVNPSAESSDSSATPKWKNTRSLSNMLRGHSSWKSRKNEKTSKTDTDSISSYHVEIDNEIMLIREGAPNQVLSEIDDEIMMVREGSPERRSQALEESPPPLTSIHMARSEDDLLAELDDEIFGVREGAPKSAIKRAKSSVVKSVRFAFGKNRTSDDHLGFGRNIDIDTLLVDSNSEDEFDLEDTRSLQTDNEPVTANETTSTPSLADFLNELEGPNGEYEYEDGEGSVDTNDTTSTDGQSVNMQDCWDLACV